MADYATALITAGAGLSGVIAGSFVQLRLARLNASTARANTRSTEFAAACRGFIAMAIDIPQRLSRMRRASAAGDDFTLLAESDELMNYAAALMLDGGDAIRDQLHTFNLSFPLWIASAELEARRGADKAIADDATDNFSLDAVYNAEFGAIMMPEIRKLAALMQERIDELAKG